MKRAAVHDAGNDLMHVIGLACIDRNHAIQLFRAVQRRLGLAQDLLRILFTVQAGNRLARQRQCMRIVLRQVVSHTRKPGVHVATAQVFSRNNFTNRRLDQRRATQKNRALVFNNDGLVAHGGHVRTACGATTHYHRDLSNAQRAHLRLVVKDAAKMLTVRKHIVLIWQVGTARVHQVDARQVVLLRNLLRTQVLFNRHGVVGTALHRCVVAHHQAVNATDAANARDDACARRAVGAVTVRVHGEGGQWRELKKRRARVKQHLHTLTRQ